VLKLSWLKREKLSHNFQTLRTQSQITTTPPCLSQLSSLSPSNNPGGKMMPLPRVQSHPSSPKGDARKSREPSIQIQSLKSTLSKRVPPRDQRKRAHNMHKNTLPKYDQRIYNKPMIIECPKSTQTTATDFEKHSYCTYLNANNLCIIHVHIYCILRYSTL
jgi:hypothetical protein